MHFCIETTNAEVAWQENSQFSGRVSPKYCKLCHVIGLLWLLTATCRWTENISTLAVLHGWFFLF